MQVLVAQIYKKIWYNYLTVLKPCLVWFLNCSPTWFSCGQRWEVLVSFLYFKHICGQSSPTYENKSDYLWRENYTFGSIIYFFIYMHICISMFICMDLCKYIIYCSSTLSLQLPSILFSMPISISTRLTIASRGRQVGWPSLEKYVNFHFWSKQWD